MQWRAVVLKSILTLGIAFPVAAQNVAILRPNQFEVGGFAGFSYGVDQSRVMGGGNVTYSALRWLLPYAEVSYFPSIARTLISSSNGVPNTKDVIDVPITAVDFGVHMRVRVPHTRIVPYVVVGAGLLHSPESTEARYANSALSGTPVWSPTKSQTVGASTNFAANFGGGIRYYLGEQFGVRAETKGYRLGSGPVYQQGARWIYQATFGFFVQFGG